MANYNDLDDLDIHCVTEDSLTITFNNAADHLKSLVSKLDNQTLLSLYGYYKQGSEGKCNIPKPSWYDVRAKSKWEAWNKLGDMPSEEAKRMYINKIKELDSEFEDTGKITTSETWVRVSTLQKIAVDDLEKNIADHIKDGNIVEIKKHLETMTVHNIHQLDDEGLSILHWSADSGFVEVLNLILSTGVDVNLQDRDGQTALHYASSCGHIDCVNLLLSFNAAVDAMDNDGCSPISVAFDDAVKNLLMSVNRL